MRNIPIAGKFLSIMVVFGLFSIATTFYAGSMLTKVDDSYSALIAGPDRAALYLARSNRALQASRAAMASILISTTKEGNAAGAKELAENHDKFDKYMDAAIAAMPEDKELVELKALGIEAVEKICAGAVEAGMAASSL